MEAIFIGGELVSKSGTCVEAIFISGELVSNKEHVWRPYLLLENS